MQVLELLAEHRGQVVSKERLFQTVWAETFVGDEVLARADFRNSPRPRRRPTVAAVHPDHSEKRLPARRSVTSKPRAHGHAGPLDRRACGRPRPGDRSRPCGCVDLPFPHCGIPHHPRDRLLLDLTQLTSLPGVEGFPALSPNGDQIVFARNYIDLPGPAGQPGLFLTDDWRHHPAASDRDTHIRHVSRVVSRRPIHRIPARE